MGDVWCEDPNKESDPDDLSGLAELWDKNRGLRHEVLKRKSLLEWQNPQIKWAYQLPKPDAECEAHGSSCWGLVPQARDSQDRSFGQCEVAG